MAEYREKLYAQVRQVLAKRPWQEKLTDRLMAACMANSELRTQLLRFIDVFPALKTNQSITHHFLSYVGPFRKYFPAPIKQVLVLAYLPFAHQLVGPLIKKFVRLFAKRFIVDSADWGKISQIGQTLQNQGYEITWDLLGEEVLTAEEAEIFKNRYLELIRRLGAAPIPEGFSRNISIKLSSLVPKMTWDAIKWEECANRITLLFSELLRAGMENNVTINVDMEQYAVRDLTMEIFKRTLERKEFSQIKRVGIVVQAYLEDSEQLLDELLDWIRLNKVPVTIRLVKGAYWDYEVINAQEQCWPIPVIVKKQKTDERFRQLAEKILKAQKAGVRVMFACASHNLDDISFVMSLLDNLGLDRTGNEFQVLYGMGDQIREAILENGHLIRIYVPCGEPIAGMAYLVRRLLENTSQQSFLGTNFIRKTGGKKMTEKTAKEETPPVNQLAKIPAPYRREALTDFSVPENRAAMQKAIRKISDERGRNYPLIIDNKRILTKSVIVSENPANALPGYVVGWVSKAEKNHAEQAMNEAQKTFNDWSNLPVFERARLLMNAADLIKEQRFELAALQTLEASKTWKEADADIAEAIDFLRYYAYSALRLMPLSPTEKLSGETNEYGYRGRGVTVVISPWNFPMAIATGMCAAALVTGNTVVFKPASSTPIIGYKIVELLLQAGIPEGVINFIPGSGNALGELLVKHPYTTNILFTGSKKIGFQLIKWAAEADFEQQTHYRRVIAEMGGKNAIIVDETADLDQAVLATVKSAFGYQGQKCSACSRVIVLESVYDEFVKRLIGATATLKVGDPRFPDIDLGAVIDKAAWTTIRHLIEIGRSEARLIYQTDVSSLEKFGYFIGPTIFTDVNPNSVLAQEEIFGPVLSVLRAQTFEQALEIANHSRYHLTGGVFTRTDEHLAMAKKKFLAGNLYLNRGITGAVVGRQPFGGFGASGTGPKAGGPDYLLPLMESITITENLTRRGFSPELKN
jgi:RHH-type proline utilization regulon transcriptional repressor/proline dehydrogenase/delta 1-pyrroline-5-carboxylate dehydrogenase